MLSTFPISSRSWPSVFQRASSEDAVRAVVVAGKGRAFSAGADIKAMDAMTDADFAKAAEQHQAMCRSARGTDENRR